MVDADGTNTSTEQTKVDFKLNESTACARQLSLLTITCF